MRVQRPPRIVKRELEAGCGAARQARTVALRLCAGHHGTLITRSSQQQMMSRARQQAPHATRANTHLLPAGARAQAPDGAVHVPHHYQRRRQARDLGRRAAVSSTGGLCSSIGGCGHRRCHDEGAAEDWRWPGLHPQAADRQGAGRGCACSSWRGGSGSRLQRMRPAVEGRHHRETRSVAECDGGRARRPNVVPAAGTGGASTRANGSRR